MGVGGSGGVWAWRTPPPLGEDRDMGKRALVIMSSSEQLPAPPGSGRSGGQRWLAGGDRGLGDSEGTGDYWEGRACMH